MEEINKTTRILLNVNDELFILETKKVLTKLDKEYLEDLTMDFFSRDEWGDEDIDHRRTLSSNKIVELIVDMSNDVKGLNLEIKKVDLDLYVAD